MKGPCIFLVKSRFFCFFNIAATSNDHQIFWATRMTLMDGGIFEEPSKFDPTRFENQASVPSYCFIPFGGGPRICPGYEFAKIETLVAIHNLVT